MRISKRITISNIMTISIRNRWVSTIHKTIGRLLPDPVAMHFPFPMRSNLTLPLCTRKLSVEFFYMKNARDIWAFFLRVSLRHPRLARPAVLGVRENEVKGR